jgi:Glucose-6-phosphate dehydrogenase subunit
MIDRMTVATSWAAHQVEPYALGATVRTLPGHVPGPGRTAVLTIVGLTGRDDATARARSVIRDLAERHPLHALIAQETARRALDAPVSATVRCYEASTGAAGVRLTDVVVECNRAAVATLAEQVRLPGLPVVAWYVDGLPDSGETQPGPLDGVVLDTHDATSAQVAGLIALTDRVRLTDLSWLRLQPWRQLFAGLFTTDVAAGFLSSVDHVQVGGDRSQRALLAGWLATRLRLPATQITTIAAAAPSIRLHARRNRTAGLFAVEPADGPDEISAVATIDGGPSHRRRLPAPRWTLIDQLDLALTRPDPQPGTYRQVLATSAALGLWSVE